jgi:hypothetical protein
VTAIDWENPLLAVAEIETICVAPGATLRLVEFSESENPGAGLDSLLPPQPQIEPAMSRTDNARRNPFLFLNAMPVSFATSLGGVCATVTSKVFKNC